MKATIIARLCKLGLIGLIAIVSNVNLDRPTQAEEPKTRIKTIKWNILCDKFPLNSRCQEGPPEIIKIPLEDFGAKDEWIRIEKTGDRVKLLFTRQMDDSLIGKAIDGAINAASPYPIPFSLFPKSWADRQTTRISFRPDNCEINSTAENIKCVISGTDVLNLPQKMNIRNGIFTLEYIEGSLRRSIAFRIPDRAKSEIGLIVVE